MITLTDIAYVRSGAADLDAAIKFATEIVGLELAAPTEAGVAHLRADHRHHCLALVEGPSGVIASGFTVADADALDAAETELERSGLTVRRGSAAEARSRRVREFIGFDDPFGNRVELVSQQETVARPVAFSRGRDHRVRPPVPGRARRARGLPVLEHALQRPGLGLARRRGLPDAHRPGAPQAGRLPRRRTGPVPHELPGRHHRRRVQELALPAGAQRRDRDGPGRHPQSTAIFLYFLGPEGFTYEYSFGVRRIEDEAAGYPGPSTRPSPGPSTCGSARPRAPSRNPRSARASPRRSLSLS